MLGDHRMAKIKDGVYIYWGPEGYTPIGTVYKGKEFLTKDIPANIFNEWYTKKWLKIKSQEVK